MALQFPVDLEDTKYEARVSFQAIKLKSVDVAAIFNNAPTPVGYGEGQVDAGLASAAGITNNSVTTTKAQALEAMNGTDPSLQTIESG